MAIIQNLWSGVDVARHIYSITFRSLNEKEDFQNEYDVQIVITSQL